MIIKLDYLKIKMEHVTKPMKQSPWEAGSSLYIYFAWLFLFKRRYQ
jgi:hypothetical protein